MAEESWLSETQQSYDTVAESYAEFARGGLDNLPRERAFLNAFAELVSAVSPGDALDAGCGPGWITAYLAERGVRVMGVDLSPGLIDIARRNHPTIPFQVGSVTDLPAAPGSLSGIVCWYVLHHIPDDCLGAVFDQFTATLTDGGMLLIGGHAGAESYRKSEGYGGLPMNVLIAKRPVEQYAQLLHDRGFTVDVQATLYPFERASSFVIMAHLDQSSPAN